MSLRSNDGTSTISATNFKWSKRDHVTAFINLILRIRRAALCFPSTFSRTRRVFCTDYKSEEQSQPPGSATEFPLVKTPFPDGRKLSRCGDTESDSSRPSGLLGGSRDAGDCSHHVGRGTHAVMGRQCREPNQREGRCWKAIGLFIASTGRQVVLRVRTC